MTGEGRSGPKYRQIADDLRARIEAGEYKPGSKLPTKAELKAAHHVALNTVDRALDELRKEGLAETVHGSGTFVRDPGPRHSPEYSVIVTRLEATERDVRELYDALGRLQPSRHRQQDGSERKDRHERTG